MTVEGLRTEVALQAGDVTFDPSTIAKGEYLIMHRDIPRPILALIMFRILLTYPSARLAAMHQPPMTPEAGAAAAAAQAAAEAAQASARTKRSKKAGKQKTINKIANDEIANDEVASDAA